MSYDLYFWKQTSARTETHDEVIDLLSQDRPIKGITPFTRDAARAAFKRHFPDISDSDFELDWENDNSYFQVHFCHSDEKNAHLIIVHCGYNLLKQPSIISKIIEAGESLGCAVYDPQTGERSIQP